MKTISRYIMTLALLITAVGGAWAEETLLLTINSRDYESFYSGSKTFDDKVTVTFSNEVYNAGDEWGWYTIMDNPSLLTVAGTNGYTITSCKFYTENGPANTGYPVEGESPSVYLSSMQVYTDASQSVNIGSYGITKIEVYGAAAPAEPDVEVTTNAAEEGATFTEASFQMPAFDATAEYELVRDMSYQVIPVMADRIRIKKSGSTYTPVDLLSVIPTVTDNLDAQNPVEMEWGTDYEMTLEKKGENNEWVATTDYSVGTFRAVIHGLNLYDGITYTNEFQLFEGYEVTVPAGEYVTYFKDENLYVEDPEAQLYTITSVGTETATATELTVAKANMPILVKNNGQEKKVILLIPTTNQADEVTVASEFVGTLEATTIAASSENQNNYAFNGKQFVWVKNAIEVGANRAWLHILTGAQSAPVLTIVFEGGTTKITNTNITNITNGNWYDLNGRKLNGMPSKKGVYLFNGKKVVVK